MDDLPNEILEIIFYYFNNNSIWNVIQVSNRWRKVVSTSTALLEKLTLTVDNLVEFDLEVLPNIPLKNLIVKNFQHSSNNDVEEQQLTFLLQKYKDSLKTLKFIKVNFKTSQELEKFLKIPKELEKVTFMNCKFQKSAQVSTINLENLKSVEIFGLINDFLEFFRTFKAITEIKLANHEFANGFNHNLLNQLLLSVPTIKKLTMEGVGTASYFNQQNFHFQLESLQAYLTTFSWTERSARSSFFQSQVGYLKDLKLERLPYDYDGGEVLKFIIEKMKLERFFYGDQALILNGIKQKIEEVWFNEVQISSGMEMMRQFPSIKKLRLLLCTTMIDQIRVNQLLNPTNDLFINLNELFIQDDSEHFDLLACFTGLYKNCQNLKILKIESLSDRLSLVLRDSLPVMKQLEELHLGKVKNDDKFPVIRDKAVNLKKLFVPIVAFYDAKNVLQESVTVGIY